MADNALKTPLVESLGAAAKTQVGNAIWELGMNLPCHVVAVAGALITVAFDVVSNWTLPQVTIPLFGPEYIRYPIREGDLGYTVAFNVPCGFTSGQASSPPALAAASNLEALMFMPIGNKNWVTVNDAAVTLYGPDGVVVRDTGSNSVITLTPTGVSITVGGAGGTEIEMTDQIIVMTAPTAISFNAPTINLDGAIAQYPSEGNTATLYGPVNVVNDLTANGISVHSHVHGGVQSGGDSTDPPSDA